MSGGLKVALIATAILALSIVGVLANDRFNRANQDDAVQARETDRDADDVKPTGKPLELGTVAKISPNYRVAVTEVTRYEVSTGQLLAATIEAMYTGKEDGEPWADFNVEFFGSGSKTFGESDCPFDLGDEDPANQSALGPGDESTYTVCIELPTKDIKGGKVLVEEAFSTDDRTFWSTKEAVTKTLPAPPPEPSAQAPAPRSQPRQQPANADRSDACEDLDEDKLEEDKEWGAR